MLDNYDINLLSLLQRNSNLTYEELGGSVALSPSACRRRISALRKAGIIQRQVAIVDAAAVGFPVLVIVLVVLEHDSREQHSLFRAEIARHPQINSCLFVTGSADYILEVNARSLSDYHALADELFLDNPEVKRFESLIVMENVHRETALPL